MTQTFETITCERRVDVLHEAGFRADIRRYTDGSVEYVRFGSSGCNCDVDFYDAQKDQPDHFKRAIIIHKSKWENLPPDAVNTWNMEKVFGRAFVDSRHNTGHGYTVIGKGITRDNLKETIMSWDRSLALFLQHLDKALKVKASAPSAGPRAPMAVLPYDKNRLH